jgi:hypothetical protein
MSELLKPPAIPTAILNFFARQPDFPAVAGDICEEFHQRVQTSGVNAARRWYWREAFRNALALTRRELLQTPIRTTLIAMSCFVMVSIATNWFWMHGAAPGRSFWDVVVTQLLILLAAGSTGGIFLPRREWALALTFTACSICMAGGLRLYYPEIRIHYSGSELASVAFGIFLRQGAFWLGCLRIRMTRSFVSIASKGASLHV